MTKKMVVLYFLNQILSIVIASGALFLSAGQIDWWPGWAIIGLWLVWFLAEDAVILHFNPNLIVERLSPPKGAKAWDRIIVSIIRIIELARYILAGLDQRHGWTGSFPFAVQIAAVPIFLLSVIPFAWAIACNRSFSQVVRIQSDHGHAVATQGPYRWIRHPGYLGAILSELALSTLLASWWAILAGGLCGILLVIRTELEDNTLQAELPGYNEYTRRVRYRLIPGIW